MEMHSATKSAVTGIQALDRARARPAPPLVSAGDARPGGHPRIERLARLGLTLNDGPRGAQLTALGQGFNRGAADRTAAPLRSPPGASATAPIQMKKPTKKEKRKERAIAYKDQQDRRRQIREVGQEEADFADINNIQIDPASRSDDDEVTRDLALAQTTAARAMMNRPGQDVRDELGAAAKQLYKLVDGMGLKEQKAMGARLLGSEGLLAGQTPAKLLAALERVAGGAKHATGGDRSVTIALMGDIGALYADTGATTGVEGRTPEDAANLRRELSLGMEGLGLDPTTEATVKRVQAIGGSSAVGPRKKKERTRPHAPKPARTGIHNVGDEVDRALGIAPSKRMETSRWDVAHITSGRVDKTAEPLVGHMSGSPAEILQVWDMLRGVPAEEQYTGALDSGKEARVTDPDRLPMDDLTRGEKRKRMARAAAASAFLIGQGYHSAVEVAEGTLAYSGQDMRGVIGADQDAGHLLGQGAATALISELLEDNTMEAVKPRVLSKGQQIKKDKRRQKAIDYQDRQNQKRGK